MIGWDARCLVYGPISSDEIQFPGIQILGVILLRKVVVYGFLEFGSKHGSVANIHKVQSCAYLRAQLSC
jgi:hypothetical protein